ncbi:GNAT family N-acetyltransferase [Gelidibacter maritimus]|uniref:GNAT family N-acetyltransferase n=1 Tax=Gelidibacter maritimus TaxID=2761487 RepID=A0A7W2M2B4_9FLAO|nr:GNAT family N-acetyltransferase [Gelidibacter maritimus]MBA6151382.1 GNAT family N-acetyltransferase [Gelidibacter maritimus]
MIEAIKEKEKWSQQLANVDESDFYFTYDYHHISKKNNELPMLIKYNFGNTVLLLPLLLRPIENTHYFDAVSVYGYAGIIAVHLDDQFNKEHFQKELTEFFKNLKIVSVFSRLHPYLEYQESLLDGLGSVTTLGPVVYIDLKESLTSQRKQFNRRTKTYLNTSRKTCTVIESTLKSDLNAFIKLYIRTMNRVNADDQYFFNDEYFHRLMASNDFNARLLLNIHNDSKTIHGGVLFIEKGPFVQYHLSALNEDYHDPSCIKLIIDEMRIKSTNAGFNFLNLGGGRGSKKDSLFAFKRNFSKKFKNFKVWKYVVDEHVYDALLKERLQHSVTEDAIDPEFFPAYRSMLNKNS